MRGDITAGITVALVMIPQALAYAKLAGDEQAARLLYACLHVLASDWSRCEGWDVPRGSGRVGALAKLVQADVLVPAAPPLPPRPVPPDRQA